jgi:hypothetical protein
MTAPTCPQCASALRQSRSVWKGLADIYRARLAVLPRGAKNQSARLALVKLINLTVAKRKAAPAPCKWSVEAP